MAEQQKQPTTPADPVPTPSTTTTSTTSPTASSSSRATSKSEGKKYRLAAGLTYSQGVAQGGEIATEEELGPGFVELEEAAQILKWGRIMYTEAGRDDPPKPENPDVLPEIKDPKDLGDLTDEQMLETAHGPIP